MKRKYERVHIPEEILEKCAELHGKGQSIASIARLLNYDPKTLLRRLRDGGYITVKKLYRHKEIQDIDINIILIRDRRELRDNFMNGLLKVRKEYAEGQKVDVSYSTKLNKPRSGSIHTGAIKGRARIKEMHRDFMLLEKQGALGVVRECINFNAILAGDVNVAVLK